jgi:hypothetical protein
MPYPKQLETLMSTYNIAPNEVWEIQAKGRGTGKYAVYHATLERIADEQGIFFMPPTMIETDGKNMVVAIRVDAVMPAKVEGQATKTVWTIGEVSPSNYRVTGNQSGYPYAMAEKRGKDRCILKLLNAHGMLYSEDELAEVEQPKALISSEQAEKIRSTAEEVGANWEVYVKYLKVNDIAELPADRYEQALAALELKRAKK